MIFDQPLEEAVLIRRYKRFLADIELPSGESITIHCPNTGSMKNCQEPGSRVWYTDSGNPQRKYPCTWQIIETDKVHLVGINTGLANGLVAEAITAGRISQLPENAQLKREVRYGEQGSRIDLLLDYTRSGVNEKCYVEVKNVSLGLEDGVGIFPDAVTTRGQKHLQELMAVRHQGHRALLFFCVQHSGIASVSPADAIDPEYGKLLRMAAKAGVELVAYGAAFDVAKGSIVLQTELPVLL